MTTPDSDPQEDQLATALLRLAAVRPWSEIALADIAKEAEMPFHELYRHASHKSDILLFISAMLDRQMLAEASPTESMSPRDQLFDLIMARMDKLQLHRASYKNLIRGVLKDPSLAWVGFLSLRKTLSWILIAANLSPEGVQGQIRMKGLGFIYANTLKTWWRDESSDLEKTMATLDKSLQQAESWAESFAFLK